MEYSQNLKENYEVIDLFPLAFYRGYVKDHFEIKENFIKDIKDYNNKCYHRRSPSNLFHRESEYNLIFDSLKINFNQYMNTLGIDEKKISYHIVKCWTDYKGPDSDLIHDLNSTRYDLGTEPSISHWHNHSDLTFVYYVSANETSDKFYLENQNSNQNDFDAIFETSMDQNILKETNKYNTKHFVVQPEEGMILIFPSKYYHYARRFTKRVGERIVIAGDVRITSSVDGSRQKQASTHPSLWRQL